MDFKAKLYAEIDSYIAKMMFQPTLKVNLRISSAICLVLNENSKNLKIHTVENIKWTLFLNSDVNVKIESLIKYPTF